MATPKILLISRKTLEHAHDQLKPFLDTVDVKMAVALGPEDAALAKKLTEAVACFNHVTAIVADFVGDMLVNDDGSTEPLGLTVIREEEPKLITEA